MPRNARLGEGACWDDRAKRLLWLDIFGKKLFQYFTGNKNFIETDLPVMIGTVALTNKDELLMAGERGIYLFKEQDNELSRICDPEHGIEGHRFNDGKVSPDGIFWAGGVRLEGAETAPPCALYKMDTDFNIAKALECIDISNGLAWDEERSIMYYIDSPRQEIWAFDYERGRGNISNKRTVVKISIDDGMPDGMTIDSDGMLWVALWRGWGVARFNPFTGEKLAKVCIDAPLASCPSFGGENMDILYITSASSSAFNSDLKTDREGCLFEVKTCARGLPTYRFQLN